MKGVNNAVGQPSSAPGILLQDLQREYLDDLKHRVSPSHFVNVKARIGKALLVLGASDMNNLQPVQVIRYRNQLRENGASNRTANLVADSLSAMFSWALGCGLIDANPLRNIRRLPTGGEHQRCRRRALTDEEIQRFLKAAEDDDREVADAWSMNGEGECDHRREGRRVPQAPMWFAFLETGARWSELTRSRWDDLDGTQRTLVLRAENTKSKKRRVLPIRQKLAAVLEGLCQVHELIRGAKVLGSDPIFRTPKGSQWSRQTNNAMRLFDRVLARAKIARVDSEGRKLDIHSLRHTFGSRLARNGVGLVQVQRLMGHCDPKLTAQVYTHLDVEDLRKAVETG